MTPKSNQLVTLKAFRTFVAVARAGSLTRASIELGLAQSAVSAQISELEKILGSSLFHRTGRGVKVTDFAERILPQVDGVIMQTEEVLHAASELVGRPRGVVTIGMVPGVAAWLTSALYRELASQNHEISVRVVEGFSGDIETALTNGKVDLAVVNRFRAKGQNSYTRLMQAQVCLVGRRSVLEAAFSLQRGGRNGGAAGELPPKVTLRDICRIPLVLQLAPNSLRTILDEATLREKVKLKILLESGSSSVLKRMVLDHPCATIFPAHAVAEETASRRLCAIPIAERHFLLNVVLATSSQRPFSLASKAVAQAVQKIAAASFSALQARKAG